MKKIHYFIIWICKKFSREEIQFIIFDLLEVLEDSYPDIKPKDNFKEKHPNYRNFSVDQLAPLKESTLQNQRPESDYKTLIKEYENEFGKQLSPVKIRDKNNLVPKIVKCPFCQAPHNYIYFNNGKKRSQLKCKVCLLTFHLEKRFTKKSKYFCPYCNYALFLWKEDKDVSVYKCGNRKCPHRSRELNKLNKSEKELFKKQPWHFKICYNFREYHYKLEDLKIPSPLKPKVDLSKIHNNINTLALILTFHISYAITARKTAHILQNVFNIKVSYQTVLNYAQSAAYYCHRFNRLNKGKPDNFVAGDETYIKISGKFHYVFYFLSTSSLRVSSYLIAANRSTLPACQSMLEVIRSADKKKEIIFVTDGNPSYQAALHFINSIKKNLKISLKKVIGLKNLDDESTKYRSHKQRIERFNRTYKYHVRPANGFASLEGAFAKTVLFVTHYNFIREHSSLRYNPPIVLDELKDIENYQGKWAKIISLAA